ncbi:MAG: hypothetical protein FWE20_08720 [Defluviitaleaceae bacterium]|nr:hypothetical protein [Defluviitaleaceae bacterium]
MPRNILHDLYNGQFSAWERRPARTAENVSVNRRIEDEKRYFMQKMSLDDCRRFEELDGLYSHSNGFEQADAFSYGFKLGAMLMCSVYTDEDGPQ